jgi:hypothetical protein
MMLRNSATLLFSILATNAFAHAGHVEFKDGHGHHLLYAGAIIAVAILAAFYVKFGKSNNV